MLRSNKFGTSVSCMDGRIQLPIIHWLQEKYNIGYVDTITEPGIDKLFVNSGKMQEIKTKILYSINEHNSKLVIISGHHDCTINPVSKNEHITQIKNAVSTIQSWRLPIKVIGAWINNDWDIEIVTSEIR